MSAEGRRLAIARDEFFASLSGATLEGAPTGRYLRNRLEVAFIAGWEAGRKDATQPAQPSVSDGSVAVGEVYECGGIVICKLYADAPPVGTKLYAAAPQPTTKKG